MCTGGGGGSDDAAKEARKAEEARQKRIEEGTKSINEQFARFDEPFFNSVEQAALDYYVPQLHDQYGDTREGVIKRLAREGNLEASTGSKQLGDLTDAANFGYTQVADRARSLSSQQRARIEQEQSRLLSQLSATADPAAAAAQSQAASLALTAPPEYSPIGDVFARFGQNAAKQIEYAREDYKNSFSPLFGPSGKGYTFVKGS